MAQNTRSFGSYEELDRWKFHLRNGAGVDYRSFLSTLAPSYARAWLEITSGYVFLLGGAAGHAATFDPSRFYLLQALGAVALAVWVGWWINFLNLFFHEAAHYNLARSRRVNDFLADVFIGSLRFGAIRRYRPVHLAHHRHLGTIDDTEVSYFNALTLPFVISTLFGIHVARVVLKRVMFMRSRAKAPVRSAANTGSLATTTLPVVIGCVFHACAAALLYRSTGLVGVAGWFAGLFLVFPSLTAVRQLLEHRDALAHERTDYRKVDHGPVTRVFRTGLVTRWFGGAGFDRHLLHHLQPTLSYTRLADFEDFLLDSEAAEIVSGATTTYVRTFRQLWR